jgi:hypothetical protein
MVDPMNILLRKVISKEKTKGKSNMKIKDKITK